MGCVAAGFLGVIVALIVIGVIAIGYHRFFKHGAEGDKQ